MQEIGANQLKCNFFKENLLKIHLKNLHYNVGNMGTSRL